MATIKQIQAAKELVGNGGNVSKAMRAVGYAEATLNTPQKLTESKGFKKVLEESGLTDTFLTKALYDDIKAKPKKRHKELELAFKVSGKITGDSGERGDTYNILNIITGDQAKRIAGRILSGNAAGEESPDRLRDSNESEIRTELAP